MKRTNLLLAGTVMCLSTFIACTNESEEMQSDELREIVATAGHFVPEVDSRAFSFVNNSVEFAWADGGKAAVV